MISYFLGRFALEILLKNESRVAGGLAGVAAGCGVCFDPDKGFE